jgi:UDP-glucose-4-epimerase GalE
MPGMVVLVAGGAGYIGSHVCKALAESGYVPVCYDTLEKGHAWAVRWGPLECGDIGDAAALDGVLERHRPKAIVHLAGYIDVGESVKRPALYFENNVNKTKTLIDAAVRHEIEAFVFSSSCSVYGVPRTDSIAEDHPLEPLNPYAASKAVAEALLNRAAAHDLRSASMRYFNAAGADSGAEIGEAHTPETHLLPLAVDAALGLGPELTLLGDDYETPDGSCIRDFVHVTDLADAHVRALEWLLRKTPDGLHEVFNLGSGSGYSVKQALRQTATVAGCRVPHQVGPRRAGDSPRLVGNIGKAESVLGWRPLRDLTVQIEDTLRWRRRMQR